MSATRICEARGCGESLESDDRRRRYCSDRCAGRERMRAKRERDAPQRRLRDAAWQLVHDGEITGWDALEMLLSPPAEVAKHLGIAP
jgi:hypothetical protein